MKENIDELRNWAKYRARPSSNTSNETTGKKERKLEL